MSCVWKGLISALKINITPLQFVKDLQYRNILTLNVRWNGEQLSQQVLKENMRNIATLTVKDVIDGYNTSGCDAALLLVSQIYNVNIIHNYNGHKIYYIREYQNDTCSGKTIYVCANQIHFQTC
jgi:hypothetical protein